MSYSVRQFQILAKNPDKAAEFYGKLFGWTVDAGNALGYRVINTGSSVGIQGGIWPAPPEGHAMIQLFVEVDDLSRMVDLALASGGNVIIPPQTLPDGDAMAVILDSEGIPFGLFRPSEK